MSSSVPSPYLERPSAKPWYHRWWVWVLIALAAIIVLVVFAGLFLNFVRVESNRLDLETAEATCRSDVESYAKYPGGVTYPEGIHPSNDDFWLETRDYTAGGPVDFVSGFNVPVRGEFSCSVTIDTKGVVIASKAKVTGIR